MVEFGQRLVGQQGDQQLLHELPLEDAMDVDIGGDTEMVNSPDTPRQGSTSNAGLLSPQSAIDNVGFQQQRPHPVQWNNISAIPQLSPVPTPAVEAYLLPVRMNLTSTASTAAPGTIQPLRISRPTTDQEMSNAPDYMMPHPDPYFQPHSLISPTDVGNATNALFTHMKARFNPASEASHNMQGIVDRRTLPLPPSNTSHQTTLSYHSREERRLPPPQFRAPGPGIISARKQKTHSLADILAAQEGRMQARQLDGMSFHHVVQQPFVNELRAHYAAEDKSGPGGREILMYKAQLPISRTPRSAYRHGEIEMEMWYFFEIKTSGAPGVIEGSVVLGIPADDVEENKAEECPMYRGGVQINARRREYSVKPFGRFKLETVNMEQEVRVWNGIRHDLEDGSCRLFTWTGV